MPTIEELVEGALGELGALALGLDMGFNEDIAAARAILSRLATEARLGALRDAIMTAEWHERHWEVRGNDLCQSEANAIKCDLKATLAATEAPCRGR